METEIKETLTRFFNDELNVELPSTSADLIEAGILDSFMLIEVVMFMETEYSVTAEFDDLEIENFVTVDSMARFVAMRQPGAVPAETPPASIIDARGV